MYCPGCGTETTQGLNYCKQCGASLVLAPTYVPTRPPAWLVQSFLAVIGLIALVGLLGPLQAAEDLRRNGFSPRDVTILCGAAMGGAALMIAFLSSIFFRLLPIYAGTSPEPASRLLNRPQPISPARIGPPPVGMASVTEQTTRSFDLPASRGERDSE